jgi:tRNA(Ile2)-agmatinylcytidine synthase
MFYIGIDDTDSAKGMCTTYIGALLVEKLSKYSFVKPRLVRLNPNIPWKTRGNASISLEMNKRPERIEELVLKIVKKYADLDGENTHPGIVFYEGEIPEAFSEFYSSCLHRVVELREAEDLLSKYEGNAYKFKEGRGIIGALAAIGSRFEDKTFEIIAYRKRENWGKERRVDRISVYKMDKVTYPLTFNNVDGDRILIAPHSPCPVLFGIRGENPEILRQAYDMIQAEEEIERAVIFETNQATDAHLEKVDHIEDIKPYSSVILRGIVSEKPRVIQGGHVIFSLSDGRSSIDCAAYEPTKEFRKIVKKLYPGDEVVVYGGVRDSGRRTINLEKIQILSLSKIFEEKNPRCICGRRMESAGRGQGFRCRRCKTTATEKERKEVRRDLEEKIYQVPPRAMRHLSKPLIRLEKHP